MINLYNIPSVLQEFAKKNNLPVASLAKTGRLTLVLNDKYRIHFIPIQKGSLVINAPLWAMPEKEEEQEKIIDMVLTMAYISARHVESYPALTPHELTITLQLTIASDIQLWEFEKRLDVFVKQFSIWRKYLEKHCNQ